MFNILGKIVDNVTGIIKNKSDGRNQEVLQDVNEVKQLKRATNYAERVFEISDRYLKFFSKRDLRDYQIFKRKFNQND